jgi:serine protease Do
MVGAMPPGARANVKLLRNGKPLDVVVVLTPLEEATALRGQRSQAPAAAAADLNAIGVVVAELDSSARNKLGLKPGEGVRIAASPAWPTRQAGLAPGDVILQVGKDAVGSTAAFENALKGVKKGDRVRLLVRNNEEHRAGHHPAS